MLYSAAMLAGRLGGWLRRRRTVAGAPEVDDGADDTDAPEEQPVGEAVREGERVRLRTHVPANRAAFQRWYADAEVARLLRHDQEPLGLAQSRAYFDTFILPLSARGLCYAIHEAGTDRLIGTTALTDVTARDLNGRSAFFRIVIGEKDVWGRGYGTEATRLVMDEAFGTHGLTEVRLEVFRHNPRALAAYRRVGFRVTGEHTEWVGRQRTELHVVEMALGRDEYRRAEPASAPPPIAASRPTAEGGAGPVRDREQRRQERQQRREERQQNPDRAERTENPTPQERQERRQRREERQQRREQREQREGRREERRQRQGEGEIDPSPS